ncbi:1-acyl-sn-glycerol-3-phosphate acyltransferase [Georgenia thermotolerans]|uniref:Acyl-phosphate glycerol 3-phosphate acyltransferase n=1 Tax=Georgenia thermotolerans TaxID=527326 RepID=A0A7J5ULP2_9MICO|nr:1-acyl-sn-glycerol-3-phosphate acyltransferase [Georgenia thermotolerans]KAE8763287.1 acyl-phosphate glycerol 3-phosphate acyltransferase [Georgenia thermotolerans]
MGRIRRALARAYWAVSRWRYRAEPLPDDGAGILIGAPHTSNWDFVLMLAIAWRTGISVRFLGKHQLFRPPLGVLMRALGGIPVDRRRPGGLVEELVGRVAAGERFYLVITPEGTRGAGSVWKSGFYRIARATDLPVTLGYVDRTTMTAGLGPTFHLTGDVAADMDRIRAFYAGKTGVRPELGTEPRLSDESADPRDTAAH